jgi:adenosine deaminase
VIPKAELHVHLEGTMTPALVSRIADRNDLPVPPGLLAEQGHFVYSDFLDFLAQYDKAASVIRTAEDYRDIAYEYLSACAREGAVYVELIASPDHARSVGLSDEEHWAGIAQGIDDARDDHGIEGWILASVVRNFGVPAAERVVNELIERPHPYVVGFNMAGDEANYPAADYAHVFEAASRDAGLGCSVHAGEHAGPQSVRAALELPGVTRISHGVRSVEDPALVAELAEREIVLEVCPTSNVVLKVYEGYASHPFNELRDAGVKLTLGSDDPPYFATTIGKEYEIAGKHFGLSADDLLALTRTAVYAGFAPDLVRQSVLKRIEPR